ncbi:MAG: DNA translocase FtsK 4TM domain-containing protein, partial [bacterium]
MAKKRKKKNGSQKQKGFSLKTQQVFAVLMILVALILLIALISHRSIDDRRILGEVDGSLDPFDLQFHNQAGMLGAYLVFICSLIMGWLAYFIPIALIAA